MTSTRYRTTYRCGDCGHDHPKWVGRCEGCGAWNSVAEEGVAAAPRRGHAARRHSAPVATRLGDVAEDAVIRWRTGLEEFDFVLGGGLVPGSMVLIGGEPGIGKSTLLLQAAARLEQAGQRVLYASGEESPQQLRLRASRLEEPAEAVHVVGDTRLERVLAASKELGASILVIDSIQTMTTDTLDNAAGSVTQVRESSSRLMRFAKETGTAVLVVGHVTKGGGIAGPKTLEHIVDTVLYFEGENTLDHRLLRAAKNRFGSVDELGVFSMTGRGLVPVPNPSALFLEARAAGTSGTAVTALMEGTRPLLVEIQALTAPAGYGTPQRVARGIDPKRLAVLLAVLERRADLSFAALDVFVQVSAGVRLTEPGADLALAAALISSLNQRPAPAAGVFLGEVGLSGDIRPVGGIDRRLGEAARQGFERCFASSRQGPGARSPALTLTACDRVDDLVRALAA